MTLFIYILARCSLTNSQNGSESPRMSSSPCHCWKTEEDMKDVCLGSGGCKREARGQTVEA